MPRRDAEGPPDRRAANLLSRVRRRTLMYQSEVGSKAGVGQGVVSAYESGARQPTLPMLSKLLEAMGFELVLDVRPLPPGLDLMIGALWLPVWRQRAAIVALAGRHGLSHLYMHRDGSELFVDDHLATMMERRLFTVELEVLLGFYVRVVPVRPEERGEITGWTVRLDPEVDQDQGRAERSDQ